MEPPDRAADGRQRRLTLAERAESSCPCGRSARTSRAAPTPTARRCGSATSTWRRTRPGAARTSCPGYERRLADVDWAHGSLIDAQDARGAARSRRRLGRRRPRRGRGHRELGRPRDPGRGRGRGVDERARSGPSGAASAARQQPADMTHRRPLAVLALDRGGDLALQPHRRARPRRLRRRRPTGGRRRRLARGRAPEPAPDRGRRPTSSPSSTPPSPSRRACCASRRARSWPTRSRWCRAPPGRRQRRVPPPRRRGRRGRRGRRSSSASPPTTSRALVVPVTELHAGDGARLRYVGVNQLGPAGLADRPPGGPRRARLHLAAGHGGPRRRLRPGPHRRPPRRQRRHRRPDRRLLRRGRPDARLPHAAGPRRPEDHARTCCSRGPSQDHARSVYTGLIRVRKEAPGTERLPDQPQPQAVRGRVGRERAQPRDREQRRALQPRQAVGPIDEEQRFYLESRGVPPGDGRAADRARASSTRCSSGCRRRTSCPSCVAPIAAKLDRRRLA